MSIRSALFVVLAATTVGLAQETPGKPETILDVSSKGTGTLHQTDIPAKASTTREPGARVVMSPELFGTSRRAPSSPDRRISVTLTNLEREVFVWGDIFTFVLRIENVGTESIQIPWSPEASLVDAEGRGTEPDAVGAMIRLEVGPDSRDAIGSGERLALLTVQSLAGSPHIPGTLHRLAPREGVKMKLYARWSSAGPGEAAKVLAQPDGRVSVAAIVTLFGEGVSQRSTNSLRATLLRPIR
jgi:hypothetical protein